MTPTTTGLSYKNWKKLYKTVFFAMFGLLISLAFATLYYALGSHPSQQVQASGTTRLTVRSTNANINVLDATALTTNPSNFPSANPYWPGPPVAYGAGNLGQFGGITAISGSNRQYTMLTDAVNTKLIAPIVSQQDTRYGFTGWLGCTSTENNWNIDTNGDWIPNTNNGGTVVPDQYSETCVISYSDDQIEHVVTATYQTTTININAGGFLFLGGNGTKILDKRTADTGSNSGNPNTYAPAALGIRGAVANYSFQTPGELVKLIAPLSTDVTYNNRPGQYEFVGWSTGCGSYEDNFDGNWNKTTNNGGTATPDGLSETCVINFPNDGASYTITANFRATWMFVRSNLWEVPVLDQAKLGQPGFTNPDPNSYPGTTAQLGFGPAGGRTQNIPFAGSGYTRPTLGGSIALIAPRFLTTDNRFAFVSWNSCDARYDNYDDNWNPTGPLNTITNSDISKNETCVVNITNNGTTRAVSTTYDGVNVDFCYQSA